MKKLIEHFIKYPIWVKAFLVLVFTFGAIGLSSLKSNFFPAIDPNLIQVIMVYPGASPEEVEQIIMSHPSIDEAAIIGVPDVEWGERVRAMVVIKPGLALTAEEVIDHCRPKMAGFKRPEDVVFMEELPRNPMGKVLKRVLREEYDQPIGSYD